MNETPTDDPRSGRVLNVAGAFREAVIDLKEEKKDPSLFLGQFCFAWGWIVQVEITWAKARLTETFAAPEHGNHDSTVKQNVSC
jgi:hypothetical protein